MVPQKTVPPAGTTGRLLAGARHRLMAPQDADARVSPGIGATR